MSSLVKYRIREVAADAGKLDGFVLDKDTKRIFIKGADFEAIFDPQTGSIYSLKYGNETVISDGNGPKLDALRAFTNNDNWFYAPWFEHGLHNLIHKATEYKVLNKGNGTLVLSFTVESQAPNAARIKGGTSSGKNSIEELTENSVAMTLNLSLTRYGQYIRTVLSNCSPALLLIVQVWCCRVWAM